MLLLKCCMQYASKFGKQQWPQEWKRSVFIPISKKGNAKGFSRYCIIALISRASKVMLQILKASLQQYMNCELPDVQAGFRKDRGSRDQIANIRWITKKAKEFQKNIYFSCITTQKPLTVWITTQTMENSSIDENTRLPDLPPEKLVCRSRSNSLNWTWNNKLVTNRKRSTSRLYIAILFI